MCQILGSRAFDHLASIPDMPMVWAVQRAQFLSAKLKRRRGVVLCFSTCSNPGLCGFALGSGFASGDFLYRAAAVDAGKMVADQIARPTGEGVIDLAKYPVFAALLPAWLEPE